jgi:hypothetical protein
MITQIKRVVDQFNATYGANISEADVYVFKSKVYLSTAKVAEFLDICPHQFSVIYSHDVKKKVHMIHQGRCKWYNLKDLTTVYDRSIKESIKFLDLCKPVELKSKRK